ncbi:hypothetical protein [Galactobacter caseinivorans]|nr:hypothetical protein [Galactobacter caseinivorans]
MSQQSGNRAVLGPFTAREVTLMGGAVLLALAALFSFGRTRGDFAVVILGLLAPLAAAGGYAWRRTRGRARLDLASFSLDQAAAVVSVTALVVAIGGMGGAGSVVQFFSIVGALAMCVATWGSLWVGVFRADFADTPEVPVLTRDVLATGAGSSFGTATATATATQVHPGTGPDAAASGRGVTHPDAPAVPHTGVVASAGQPGGDAAFWFAVPTPRPVSNRANGSLLFTAEPGAWWLAVRRVPEGLVVRHDDGREGLLSDTTELELA